MNKTQRLTRMAVLVAIGTISSNIVSIPTGIAKAFPIQHAINVIAAVMLGPIPAVTVAFAIALLRNLLGAGTLLAFPGGMIGALLAGLVYQRIKRTWGAWIGEVFGTGVIGSFLSVPFAQLFMGKSVGALAFLPSFLTSTIIGASIGWIVVGVIQRSTNPLIQRN
ncbi:energy coupling factor transporter S component ThiW [Brevibacillus ginsengisoli]|uniref:energy coupling factor transporter S component ThiW n=1 Tax=Brevibacillus ginsengisoli TaxID=363854 RepID=UPI003CF1FB41